ncbi:hypothetical protein AGR1B_Cc60012 [Agrobacterium fabacearum S56]|nr:hypothetical protein AGR1B_Cc60012 [Agrobacterium fabacearum S56]
MKISGGNAFSGLRMSERAKRAVANFDTGAAADVSGSGVRRSVPGMDRSFIRVEHSNLFVKVCTLFYSFKVCTLGFNSGVRYQ